MQWVYEQIFTEKKKKQKIAETEDKHLNAVDGVRPPPAPPLSLFSLLSQLFLGIQPWMSSQLY